MRAVGMLCGVGSLLREAQDAGFHVIGNFETRRPFLTFRETWEANFKGKLLTDQLIDTANWAGDIDLMIGHPPCNSHSALGNNVARLEMSAKERAERIERRSKRIGLLPVFTERVRALKPRIFVLDNLAKILQKAAPVPWWEKELPGYRLTFLQIANWDFGTPQLRKRLWVVGTRSKHAFMLDHPRTRLKGPKTVREAIGDLPWEPWINDASTAHYHKEPDAFPSGGYRSVDGSERPQTTTELATRFLALAPKTLWPYKTDSGRIAFKLGRARLGYDERSGVLSGLETLHHPLTGWPLTPRERARLMDWPDDFHLASPTRTTLTRGEIMRLVLFTGKAVPSRFPRFLMPQIIKHLKRY